VLNPFAEHGQVGNRVGVCVQADSDPSAEGIGADAQRMVRRDLRQRVQLATAAFFLN